MVKKKLVPQVAKYRDSKKLFVNPTMSVLKSSVRQIFVKFLSLNVTALVQQMDLAVIHIHEENIQNKSANVKKLQKFHSIYSIACAGDSIKRCVKPWRKLLPDVETTDNRNNCQENEGLHATILDSVGGGGIYMKWFC